MLSVWVTEWKNKNMIPPRWGGGEVFYCRYERESSQRHLEGSRQNQTMGGEGGKQERKKRENTDGRERTHPAEGRVHSESHRHPLPLALLFPSATITLSTTHLGPLTSFLIFLISFFIPHHFTIPAMLFSSRLLRPLKNCLEHYKAIKS